VSTRPRPCGFTLLELLVALALFALVAAMSFGGLSAMVRTHDALRAQSERLAAVQLAVGLVERDFRQAAPRPIRDGLGESRPALSGQQAAFELSAFAAASPLVLTRPSLQRVAYAIDKKQLTRFSWAVLDRAPATTPVRKVLLDDADELRVRYLARDNRWFDAWPPPKPAVSKPEDLPRAVEIELKLADYGTLRRLFVLPDATLQPASSGTPPPGAIPPGLVP